MLEKLIMEDSKNIINVSNTIVSFGKHSGKTYDLVLQTDVSYCNWLLRQVNVHGRLLQFQQWLKNKSTRKATCECCNGTGVINVL